VKKGSGALASLDIQAPTGLEPSHDVKLPGKGS